MARRVRKTHKQKQRDLDSPEIIEEHLWSLSDWMEQNWKPVIAVVGGLTLLWAGIGLFQIMRASSAQEQALATAPAFEAAGRAVYEPPADLEGEDPNAPLGPSFKTDEERAAAVMAASAGKEAEAGGLIGVLAGGAHGAAGKLDAQLAALDAALKTYSGDALELPLREQRASVLTGLKKTAEAAAEWEKVATLAPTAQLKAEAQLRVGDLYNPAAPGGQADAAKAKAAYEAALKASMVADKAPSDGPLAFLHAEATTKLAGL